MGHFTNNVLTILQKEKNIDLQSAADYAGVLFKELYEQFVTDQASLPSFGAEMDAVVE